MDHFYLILMSMAFAKPNSVLGNKTLNIAYTVPWSHDWVIGPYMGSAIVLGIEEVRQIWQY